VLRRTTDEDEHEDEDGGEDADAEEEEVKVRPSGLVALSRGKPGRMQMFPCPAHLQEEEDGWMERC